MSGKGSIGNALDQKITDDQKRYHQILGLLSFLEDSERLPDNKEEETGKKENAYDAELR